MMWLIEETVAREMQAAAKSLSVKDRLDLQARAEREASMAADRIMEIANGTAVISIRGVLLPQTSFISYLFGNGSTTYSDIQEALARAEADPGVKQIVLDIDSPGGRVDGFFECAEALRLTKKPVSVTSNYACSAAYGLAAASGGEIRATSEASCFGSIGVAVMYLFWADEEVVDITSTEAPDKRPDVRTEEGKAVVRKELDAIHELFAEAIAEGRGVTVDQVNADFGRGSVFLAAGAKAAGLIDKVPARKKRPQGASAEAQNVVVSGEATNRWNEPTVRVGSEEALLSDVVAGDRHTTDQPQANAARERETPTPTRAAGMRQTMNEEELKAQHPALYEAVRASGMKAAAEKAVAEERDRVSAHLKMGEASGAMETAIEAVKSGAGMTQSLQAEYMAAGMNRASVRTRQEETDQAAAAADGAEAVEEASDDGDRMADAVDRILGKKTA